MRTQRRWLRYRVQLSSSSFQIWEFERSWRRATRRRCVTRLPILAALMPVTAEERAALEDFFQSRRGGVSLLSRPRRTRTALDASAPGGHWAHELWVAWSGCGYVCGVFVCAFRVVRRRLSPCCARLGVSGRARCSIVPRVPLCWSGRERDGRSPLPNYISLESFPSSVRGASGRRAARLRCSRITLDKIPCDGYTPRLSHPQHTSRTAPTPHQSAAHRTRRIRLSVLSTG